MKYHKLITVIVPVYNSSKYLRNCLDSIINQTYKNLEILIINDGSTDNSNFIINKYRKKDERFKVVTQKNYGYGYTINRGIMIANGFFVSIVESDDFIHKEYFETLIKYFDNKTDVVRCNFYDYFDKYYYLVNKSYKNFFLLNKDIISPNFKPHLFPDFMTLQPSIWNYVYKKDFLIKNNIKLTETPGATFQDLSFHSKLLLSNPSIKYIDEALYYYRQHEDQSIKNNSSSFYIFNIYKDVLTYSKGNLNAIKELLILKRFIADFSWNMTIVKNKYKFFTQSRRFYINFLSKFNTLGLKEYENSVLKSLTKNSYLWYRYGSIIKKYIQGYNNPRELHINLRFNLNVYITIFKYNLSKIFKTKKKIEELDYFD